MLFIDLHFLGMRRVVGAAVLPGPSGLAIVDPGPTACLPALESGLADHGLGLDEVRTILLTHVHLDHAGATGTLLARLPRATAYVHERGAPHLVDPSKLLASATRLYGSNMERFWGDVRAVPTGRLHILADGERLDVAGRSLEVAYTPGHAVHHVSFFDIAEGRAYVGDTAGIRVAEGYVKAPTPPPDIDLEAWEVSLQRIEQWRPQSRVLTQFGLVSDPENHLRQLRAVIGRMASLVRATLEREATDEERMQMFADDMRAEARRLLSPEDAKATEAAAGFDQLWLGLARYFRKKSAA
jgi:glyoxylase-like metal-dependent hydrolase (beta-lactamase superfamily II)